MLRILKSSMRFLKDMLSLLDGVAFYASPGRGLVI